MEQRFKLTPEEILRKHQHGADVVIPVVDADDRNRRLLDLYDSMNSEQRSAFETAVHFFDTYDATTFASGGLRCAQQPLRMFLTGAGGCGKTHIVTAIKLYAQLKWGKTHSAYGPAVAVAPTGNAAHNVGGHTWHSLLGKTQDYLDMNKPLPQDMIDRLSKKLSGLRVLILDEVSMVSLQDLYEIHLRCHAALNLTDAEMRAPFANLHVILLGDLYQLPPVGGTAVYNSDSLQNNDRSRTTRQESWRERGLRGKSSSTASRVLGVGVGVAQVCVRRVSRPTSRMC